MKYFQLALICFICVAKSYGQTGTRSYGRVEVEITKEKKPRKISTKVEIRQPAFPGGDSLWAQSLQDSLNRSIRLKNKVKAGTYIVSVRFLIEKDGSMAAIQCLSDPGFGMCEQVVAAITRKYGNPRWLPLSSGKVRQYHTSATKPQDE